MRSSFDGEIMEIPEIAVDNFLNLDRRGYFLSHCHTDHTEGLYKRELVDYLQKENVFIYMSELSAVIVCNESERRNVTALVNYIKPLPIDTTEVTFPAKGGREAQYISVTLIPAGHCLGSVMFLFKTQTQRLRKTILYTGDFRISENSVSKYGQLHENGEKINVDTLYVDTTFQNNKFEFFPKRSESVEVVIREISTWLNQNNTNKVAFHTSAKYGYESVFNDIYQRINEKTYVNDELWNLYRQIPSMKGVTNEAQNCRIHKCRIDKRRNPKYRIYKPSSHAKCHPCFEVHDKYLYIHLSARYWKELKIEDVIIKKYDTMNNFRVCFATHCSRAELEYFVNYLSPKKIVGFEKSYMLKGSQNVTPAKRNAPRSADKIYSQAKSAKVDKATVRQIFF